VWNHTNLYGCNIGDNCMIGSYVEIQRNVNIGNTTRIQSHSFICSNTNIGDNCFVAHGVMFINDDFKSHEVKLNEDGPQHTRVENNVIIGTNATIFPVTLGANCIIGAGAVVTKDVPANSIVVGNPARVTGYKDEQ